MINENTPFDLINAIYSTAEDASAWPVALERMRVALNSSAAIVGIFDMHSQSAMQVNASVGFSPEEMRRYMSHFEADDMRSKITKLMPVGRTIADQDRYYDVEAFHRSPVWNEIYEPGDYLYKMSCILFRQGTRNASIPFHRGSRQGPFTDKERSLFQVLVPHIQRTIQLHRRIGMLETRAKTFAGVLELMPDAAFLTTAAGRIVMLNECADELLQRRDGITAHRGRLTARQPEEDRPLHWLIADAAANGRGLDRGAGGSLRITRADSEAYFVVTVAPVRGAHERPLFGDIDTRAAAMVVVAEPLTRPGFPAQEIAQVHGLTKAEARLAAAIAAGDSVKLYADRHELSENTVRWTLKRVLFKTGVSSQSALVRLLTPRPLARR